MILDWGALVGAGGAVATILAVVIPVMLRQGRRNEARIDRLEQSFERRMDRIEQRLDTRMDRLEQSLDALAQRVARLEGGLSGMISGSPPLSAPAQPGTRIMVPGLTP